MEVYGFTNVIRERARQVLRDVGFTRKVEGDYDHHVNYPVCGLVFNNDHSYYPDFETRITIGTSKSNYNIPTEVLAELKSRIPDILFVDAMRKKIEV
jgi:hypothetical protein